MLWSALVALLIVVSAADNLAMAQANCFVLFLVLVSLMRFREGKDVEAGFWIGFAAAIKAIPALFFPLFVFHRRWKALAGILFAALICGWLVPAGLVGTQKNVEYHRQWLSDVATDGLSPLSLPFFASQLNASNQSLRAVVFRWALDSEHRFATGAANGREFLFRSPLRFSQLDAGRLASGSFFALAAITLFTLWRSARDEKRKGTIDAAVSMLFAAMVLLAPQARSHVLMFLCVPWLVLLKKVLSENSGLGHSVARAALLVSALLYLSQADRYFKFLGAGCLSALVVFVYFVWFLLRRAPAKVRT
jgi:hypothetical protein